MSKKQYVLGFIFDKTRRLVVMIKKNEKTWQAGMLNGVGGKVNPEDPTLNHAMAREANEECGLRQFPGRFIRAGTLEGDDYEVIVFYTVVDDIFKETTQGETDEGEIMIRSTRELILEREKCVYHVPVLIHMCEAQMLGQDCKFTLEYNETDQANG